jgi:hypothetical protein
MQGATQQPRTCQGRPGSLLFALAALLSLWLAPARAGAQTCPTIQDVLQVTLGASVSYANGTTQSYNTGWVHQRNQAAECGSPRQAVVGDAGCARAQLPLPRLVAEKLLVAADRRVGLLDLACGNLQGTFSLGQAPFAAVSGSFVLRARSAGSLDITLSVFVPAGPGLESLFNGAVSSRETIRPSSVGSALSTGTMQIETTLGTGTVPISVAYNFVGNSSASLPSPHTVEQDLNYDCATGTLRSELCLISAPAVPASSWASLAALGLILLGIVTWSARRAHA